MCSYQIGGSTTYFDKEDGTNLISLSNNEEAQCLGAYAIDSDNAQFLLLMTTNKYRLLTINFSGGSNNIVQ